MSPVKVLADMQATRGALKGANFHTEPGSRQITGLGYAAQMETAMITDVQLKQAAEQAQREGSVRPLVMQQLRAKIQLDRLKVGKEELRVQFEEPKTYEMTAEEKLKQEKRKSRNRQAAKKSRQKKKGQHSALEKKNEKLKEKNNSLRAQLNELYDLTSSYQQSIQRLRQCPRAHPRHPAQALSRQLVSVPLSRGSGHKNVVRHSGGLSFQPPQQIFPNGRNLVSVRRPKEAATCAGVFGLRVSSDQESSGVLSRGDPPDAVACSPSTSPEVALMDVEGSFSKVVPRAEFGREGRGSAPRVVTFTAADEAPGVTPMASPPGPPGPAILQGVDVDNLQAVSFLQLLQGPETPEMEEVARNAAYLYPAFVHLDKQDNALGVSPSAPTPGDLLTGPASPISPNAIFGAMQRTREP